MVSIGGIVSVGGSSGGGGSGSTSGITTINPGGNHGPTVIFQGANGIQVTSPSANVVLIDGAGASGTININKFIAVFNNVTAVTGIHNIGNEDIIVQVYNESKLQIIPDEIEIIDMNSVAIRFNTLQSGKMVVLG
jgi:hypothetical protein